MTNLLSLSLSLFNNIEKQKPIQTNSNPEHPDPY